MAAYPCSVTSRGPWHSGINRQAALAWGRTRVPCFFPMTRMQEEAEVCNRGGCERSRRSQMCTGLGAPWAFPTWGQYSKWKRNTETITVRRNRHQELCQLQTNPSPHIQMPASAPIPPQMLLQTWKNYTAHFWVLTWLLSQNYGHQKKFIIFLWFIFLFCLIRFFILFPPFQYLKFSQLSFCFLLSVFSLFPQILLFIL